MRPKHIICTYISINYLYSASSKQVYQSHNLCKGAYETSVLARAHSTCTYSAADQPPIETCTQNALALGDAYQRSFFRAWTQVQTGIACSSAYTVF